MRSSNFSSTRAAKTALILAGIGSAMNFGVKVGPANALRIPDLICLAAVATCIVSGARGWMGRRMVWALMVTVGVLAVGLYGVDRAPQDFVFIVRLAEMSIMVALGFWAARTRTLKSFLAGILIGSVAAAVIALWETHVYNTGGWTALRDFDLNLARFVVKENPGHQYWVAGGTLRPSSVFDHPNQLAGYLGLVLAGVIAFLSGPQGKWARVACCLGGVTLTAGVIVTGSRGGLVAAVFGLVFAFGVRWKAQGRKRSAIRLVALLLLLVGGVKVAVDVGGAEYASRAATTTNIAKEDTVSGRLASWRNAAMLVNGRPLQGWGRAILTDRFPSAHNAFIFTAVVVGLPLALVLLLFASYVGRAGWQCLIGSGGAIVRCAGVGVLVGTALAMMEDRAADPGFMSMFALAGGASMFFRTRHQGVSLSDKA